MTTTTKEPEGTAAPGAGHGPKLDSLDSLVESGAPFLVRDGFVWFVHIDQLFRAKIAMGTFDRQAIELVVPDENHNKVFCTFIKCAITV